VVMELVLGQTLHSILGWSGEQIKRPLSAEENLVAMQSAKALEYLESFGVAHRDFRTANLILHGNGASCRICVLDFGHMVAVNRMDDRNRSAVIRCRWEGAAGRHFDWAPPEVRDSKDGVNFALPVHSFDMYSLAVLLLQLESGSAKFARESAALFAAGEALPPVCKAIGLGAYMLQRMLGDAADRPHPSIVRSALLAAAKQTPDTEQEPPSRVPLSSGGAGVRDRSRSPICKGAQHAQQQQQRGAGERLQHLKPSWHLPDDLELVDDCHGSSAAAGYDSDAACEDCSGSATEGE